MSNFNVMLSCCNNPKYYDQVYDNIIFSKGLLLRTNNKISEQLAKPENESLRADVSTLHALQTRLVRDSIHTFDVYSTNDSIRQIEKKLAVNLIGYQSVDSIRSQYSIQAVKRSLGRGEAAIEFVRLREIISNPDSAKAYYAAVVLKKDSRHPHIVRLCSEDSLLRVQQMPDEIRSSGVRPYVQNELYRQYLYGSGDYQWRPSGRKPIKFTCVGDNLYNMIWKPIESLLQGVSTIYYSTDGELNSMAFSAIPANGKNLAEKYTLNYLTSTAEIPTVKTKSRKKPTSASLYGGINYDTSAKEMSDLSRGYAHVRSRGEFRTDTISIERGAWGFLLGSELEVTDISAQLTSAGVANKVFSESLANEESFKANSGNSPSILHIATHGFFYPNEKENNSFAYLSRFKGIEYVSDLQFTMNRAGLLFSGANHAWRGESTDGNVDDGILTADEISRLDLSNTDMVVLSACETGLGVNVISEGVLGLQRAFKLAGVQTLVMSLWKVPDDETREFMSLFYKNWLGGMDKREAFQAAQQEIKKAKPNPYYWAGFVMMD
ncbi:MAG: CHAT domain-containing protein [Bacteroidales bacterium]|nr:CHAT domain-containing protein [Bacteroidales bacterium]